MNNKINVRVLCYNCGVIFYCPIDSPNFLANCPTCYNKQMKCYYCDQNAEFTQPEIETGIIIDVCKKHFTWMHVGQEKP